MAEDPKELSRVMALMEEGKSAQAKLEQTLGRALLTKLAGGEPNLSAIFKELSGTDPTVDHVLTEMNAMFNRLVVKPGEHQLRAVINSTSTVELASAECSKAEASVLARSREQVAFTLGEFADPATKSKIFDE